MARGKFRLMRCAMDGVEAVEADTDHVFSRHTHEQFGIGVIARGAQTSTSGRGMVDAMPGNVITVNPDEVHDGAPIGDSGRAWTMLYFDPSIVVYAIDDVEGTQISPEFRHPVLRDRLAAADFHRLYAIVTGNASGSSIEGESLLLTLVSRLISERDAPSESTVPSSLHLARSLIDDGPAEDITLGDLAGVCTLSRFQVLRGFVKMTGLTPHAYLMQKRADLARRLIRRGLALADVAVESGFADQSHMTRSFVSKYGLTPGAYAAIVA